MRLLHAGDPVDGRDAADAAARRGDAAADLDVPQRPVERGVGRVQEPLDVDLRRGRAQPDPLVRLVPDEPAAHPRVAARGRGREGGDTSRRASAPSSTDGRRSPSAGVPVTPTIASIPCSWRPRRTASQRAPAIGGVERVGGVPRPLRGDLVPAEREAHDLDAECLELREPRVDGAGPAQQPGVVLDPVADAGGRVGAFGRGEDDEGGGRGDQDRGGRRTAGRHPALRVRFAEAAKRGHARVSARFRHTRVTSIALASPA